MLWLGGMTRVGPAALLAVMLATVATPRARADESTTTTTTAPEPGEALGDVLPEGEALPNQPARERAHHRALTLGALGGLYAGFSTWAWYAWYRDRPHNHAWKAGGDGLFERTAYAGGSDKLGHAAATMTAARLSSQLLRLDGWSPRQAALIGYPGPDSNRHELALTAF